MEVPVHREWNIQEYFELLRRRRWLLIIGAILGGASGFLLAIVLPPHYTSHTLVSVEEPAVSDTYAKPVTREDVNQWLANMAGQVLGPTKLQELVEKFGPYKKDVGRVPMEVMIERLKKSIKVVALNPLPGTLSHELPGFSVDVTLSEPRLAQQVCAEMTFLLMDQNIRQRRQQAELTTQFLTKQVEEEKAKLDGQEAQLAAFQSRHAGELSEDEKINDTQLAGMKRELEAVRQGLNEDRQERTFDESRLSHQLAALKTAASREKPLALEQQLSDMQNQLASLQRKYTDSHPNVIKLKRGIAQLQKEIQERPATEASRAAEQKRNTAEPETPQVQQLRAQLDQLNLNISQKTKHQEDLQREIGAMEARTALSSVIQQEFEAVTQGYQTALHSYEDLLKKRNASQAATAVESQQQAEKFHVLDPPNLPEQPSFPDRRLCSLGGLCAGLALTVGIVRLCEARDKSIRTRHDVEIYLGIPALALIPPKGKARKIRGRTNAGIAARGNVLGLSSSSWKQRNV